VGQIPQFRDICDTVEYHLKAQALSALLNDGHIWTESSILNRFWGVFSPPIRLSCIEGYPVVTEYYSDSLASLYNIRFGDQILEIDGVPIKQTIKDREMYYSFSNRDHFNRRMLEELLFSPKKDSMSILLKRVNDTLLVRFAKYYLYELYQIQDSENYTQVPIKIIENSIGYLNLKYLDIEDINWTMDSLLHFDKIIIDIRNYPKGVLYELSKYFNPLPTNFVNLLYPNLDKPGEFIRGDTLKAGIINSDYYKGEIVLLVNEQTQSHAEFTTMCLQSAPNSTTIGSTTAGTDGNVSYIMLPGGIISYFTGIGIEYPDGTPTQRQGVKIDYVIRPKIEDYYNNYDRLLMTAIKN